MIKQQLRLFVSAIIGMAILIAVFPVTVMGIAAETTDFDDLIIDRRSMLDLSSGIVSGEIAQYFIDFTPLPDWTDDVLAQRDIIGGNSAIVERVRFYVRSMIRPNRDHLQMMFAIYVIDRAAIGCETNIPLDIVSRSRYFVFAVRYGENNFSSTVDRLFFDLKLQPLDTSIKMRRFITFPASQTIEHRNTAIVYGVPMNSQIRQINGTSFIQLREAAEIMGFTVMWSAETMDVTLSRWTTRDTFHIYCSMTHDHRNIPMRLINGRTYVAVAYFSQVIGNHISLDQRANNIIIS